MAEDEQRALARALAREALARGDPLGWFERLYAHGDDPAAIPWADLRPNPLLVEWVARDGVPGRRALVVGCGLGDDAQYLSALGLEVTAFDLAPSAIGWCRRRFPTSAVDYAVADLLGLPARWRGGFDFVLAAYTLQVLPPSLRAAAALGIAAALAPGGSALVVSRGREATDPPGELPWPLLPEELAGYFSDRLGTVPLETVSLEDFLDDERPPVRRLRLTLRRAPRPGSGAPGSSAA